MIKRNRFEGDTFTIPDTSRKCWYLVDLNNEKVDKFDVHQDLVQRLEQINVDPNKVELMRLKKAQRLREKELGFRFNTGNVYSVLPED